jgi:hypothetical protein
VDPHLRAPGRTKVPVLSGDPNVCGRLTGSEGWCGDGGKADAAKLYAPEAAAVLPGGRGVLIADTRNTVIRKVSPTGVMSTVAGDGLARSGFWRSCRRCRAERPRSLRVPTVSLHGETCGEVRLDHSTMTVDHVTSASSTGFVRRKGRVRVTTGSGEAAEEVARILRERVCGRRADDGVHCRRSQPDAIPTAECGVKRWASIISAVLRSRAGSDEETDRGSSIPPTDARRVPGGDS